MARLFDYASSEYLEIDQVVFSSLPFAVSLMYKQTPSGPDYPTLFSIGDVGSDDDWIRIVGWPTQVVYAQVAHTATGQAITSTSFTEGVWSHICALFVTTTDRRILLDAGGKGTSNANVSPAGLDRTAIGRLIRSSPGGHCGGDIAEVAIWDLSAWPGATNSDKADNFEKILPSLVKGATPDTYPLGLVAYWDLVRGLNDKVGGYNLTASGTIVSAHPRIILPIKPQLGIQTGEVKELAGTVSGQSVVTGTAKVTRKISTTVAVESTTSGILSITKKIAGSAAIQSATTGVLNITKKITGSVAAESTTTGTLRGIWLVVGTVAIESTTSGAIKLLKKLTGTVTCESATSGSVKVASRLTSTVAAQCSISGTIRGIWLISGTIGCTCTVSGNLIIPRGLSNFAENKLLDHIVGKSSFSKPTVYVGFCTADPGEEATGVNCNEVSNTHGYARTPTSADDWNSASGGAIDNANAITSPCATGSWGEVTHYVLLDSGTYGEGNALVFDKLDVPKTIEEDDSVEFAAGELSLVLD